MADGFTIPGVKGEVVWNDRFPSNVAFYPPECLPSSLVAYSHLILLSESLPICSVNLGDMGFSLSSRFL